ncbi:MAG: B12-binding domain-containing radical SAM protein [Eubacteriales bacterium]
MTEYKTNKMNLHNTTNVLLVYPEFPKTFWSFQYALKFISKKSGMSPLGLVSIASLLPSHWKKKLVDMNTGPLGDGDLLWADYVLISAMDIQKASARLVVNRCKSLGVKTVMGGPMISSETSEFEDVDHLLTGEGELTIPQFLTDLENGCAKHLYNADEWACMTHTPVPAWELLDFKNYACLNIQYSRGCPFDCEFCDITSLYGHAPRTKSAAQVLRELDAIYQKGWRGGIFFVDDNFIGNRGKLKSEVLPLLADWMKKRDYPFNFLTEVSINVSDDEELMRLMVRAGFRTVFIGVETVSEESLAECNKLQNKNRDLLACVKRIQRMGLQVQGGFIVGFDSDTPEIFDRMIRFIQDSGIVTAMVGLLNAPKRTKLYQRLQAEGRISSEFNGNNTDLSTNVVPKMNLQTLLTGYQKIVSSIYSPKQYYQRIKNFLTEYHPAKNGSTQFSPTNIAAFFRANLRLGLIGRERTEYWKLFFWSLFKKPAVFPLAISLSIYGYHFRRIFEQSCQQADSLQIAGTKKASAASNVNNLS